MAYKIYFDNVDVLTDYGVFLIKERGLLDPLKHKKPYIHNWDDNHGLEIADGKLMADIRKITLELGIKATSKANFRGNMMDFVSDVLGSTGLVQMRIDEHPIVNMVMVDNLNHLERLTHWNDVQMVGKFRINLIDPYPINRQWLNSGSSQSTVTVDATAAADSGETLTVFWGDGTRDEVSEDGGGVSSSYSSWPKRIVVAGRLDLFTTISCTNATEQTW